MLMALLKKFPLLAGGQGGDLVTVKNYLLRITSLIRLAFWRATFPQREGFLGFSST